MQTVVPYQLTDSYYGHCEQNWMFCEDFWNFHTYSRNAKSVLSDFINLTRVHNFTVSAQDSFTFRRLSVFTVSFTGILQLLMQIMKLFALYY